MQEMANVVNPHYMQERLNDHEGPNIIHVEATS